MLINDRQKIIIGVTALTTAYRVGKIVGKYQQTQNLIKLERKKIEKAAPKVPLTAYMHDKSKGKAGPNDKFDAVLICYPNQ